MLHRQISNCVSCKLYYIILYYIILYFCFILSYINMHRPNEGYEDLLEYTNICALLMGASYCLKYWQFLFLV